MGLGHGNIGLPAKTIKKYKTAKYDGKTIKSVNVSYYGTNVGWNVWIDGKKYFKNCLTRTEAIQACLGKLNDKN
jgi:hypothetical protein